MGDTVTYSCESGFEAIGNVIATCAQIDEDTASFEPDAPMCLRKLAATTITVEMYVTIEHL